MAAQELLADEAEALTRKVEAALGWRSDGDAALPRTHFAPRPRGQVRAEGQAIARMVTTFVQTIETSDFDRRLTMLEADLTRQPSGGPTA
jgi:hypothetical protein